MLSSCAARRIQALCGSSVVYGPAMPYWRNTFEVAREERLQATRKRTAATSSVAAQALVGRPTIQEVQAPSTDGLEVFEITVLDISLGAES